MEILSIIQAEEKKNYLKYNVVKELLKIKL